MSDYDFWADDSWERQARDERIDRQDAREYAELQARDRLTRDAGESGGRVRVRHVVRLGPDGEKAA